MQVKQLWMADIAKPQEISKENQTPMLHGTINTSSQPPPASTHGGRTCCAPHCNNNSRRNPKQLYHKMPKDPKLEKIWTKLLKTKGLRNPGPNHYLRSAHFRRGKKTYDNNIPTVFPVSTNAVNKY